MLRPSGLATVRGAREAPGPTYTRARGTKNEPTSGPTPRSTIDPFHPARVRLRSVGNLYRDRRPDSRLRIVTLNHDVVVSEVEQRAHGRIEPQLGKRPQRAGELQAGLLQVVGVEVGVAERVDEIAGLEPRRLRHHVGEQRVGGDVEGNAEEHVGR